MSRNLDWRWISIGVAIMLGLSLVAGLLSAAILGNQAAVVAEGGQVAIGGGQLFLLALLSFASFVLGGFIVGLKSPGRTILEPGISAAIAVLLSLLIAGSFSIGGVLAAGVVPFLGGLLGGWLGERQQGRSMPTLG